MKRKAWSPYKDSVINYVREHPGCCKYDVAAYVARRCSPNKLYYIVNTAIRNGWIVAEKIGNRYSLTVGASHEPVSQA